MVSALPRIPNSRFCSKPRTVTFNENGPRSGPTGAADTTRCPLNHNGIGGPGTEEAHEPRECMPCRGTGKVISNLGGTPSDVTCPWCDGTGVRTAGIDAQAKWRDDDAPAPAEAD